MSIKPLYEIQWPPITEFINQEYLDYNDQDLDVNYLVNFDIEKIINEKFLNYCDIEWGHLIYFKKKNMTGSIHIDNTNIDDNQTLWGINWVVDGYGVMEYWNLSSVDSIGRTQGSLNVEHFGLVPKFTAIGRPDSRFILKKNCVYLINASLPHRAIGIGSRRVFSLRARDTKLSWQSVVEKLRDFVKLF